MIDLLDLENVTFTGKSFFLVMSINAYPINVIITVTDVR